MPDQWRILLPLLFLVPFSSAQETHTHGVPENWEKYRFPSPAYRPFRTRSTEAWLCSTPSLTPLPKRHLKAWPNWIRGVP
jgi:hypothetical protein